VLLASTKHPVSGLILSSFVYIFFLTIRYKQMTSVIGGFNQIPANKLWTNILSLTSSIVDSNNNLVPWLSPNGGTQNWAALGLASTPGAAVLRDMGRNVYIPDPNVATTVGSQSTVLRRVQLLPTGANGYYGTGNAAGCLAGSDTDYFTGYIRLGGQTYGGGNGVPTPVARIN
jgi:hypothetical protein